jgi:hypothetical protein
VQPNLQTVFEPEAASAVPEESHLLQAKAFLDRWRNRRKRPAALGAAETVPAAITLPENVLRHYRNFAWVIYEQRVVMLVLVFLAATTGWVWVVALRLEHKPPVVIRAPASLKEAAAAFYGVTDISYDQLVFFLHGCLPLLYTVDDGGHPLLPLAEGLIAPAIYEEAEKRLNTDAKEVEANHMTQSLTLTGISDVVADTRSARAAAYVRGYVTVTMKHDSTTIFPWRAQVVLQANPVSRLNPYPFYLAELTAKVGPDALAWDRTHSSALNP